VVFVAAKTHKKSEWLSVYAQIRAERHITGNPT
jgi:hypothetical protein